MNVRPLETESIWFRSAAVIGFAFSTGVFVVNAVYWERVLSNNQNTISNSEATMLIWLNVIFALLSLIMFIWAIVRLFFHPEPHHHKSVIQHRLHTPLPKITPSLPSIPVSTPVTDPTVPQCNMIDPRQTGMSVFVS